MPEATALWSLRDYTGEACTVEVPLDSIAVGNYADLLTFLTNFRAALDTVTTGLIWKEKLTGFMAGLVAPGVRPASLAARNEAKAMVQLMKGAPSRRGRAEIPAPDTLLQHNTHDGLYWSPGNAANNSAWDDLVSTLVQSPFGTGAATVLQVIAIVDVGRNV